MFNKKNKRLRWDDRITIYETYSSIEYDRHPISKFLSFIDKLYIGNELNLYKLTEMNVHKDSRQNNKYH